MLTITLVFVDHHSSLLPASSTIQVCTDLLSLEVAFGGKGRGILQCIKFCCSCLTLLDMGIF